MEAKLITRMYSRAFSALVLAFLAALLLVSSIPAMAYSGNGTYIDYMSEQGNWDYGATRHCPDMSSETYSFEYRSRYRWAEFCGDLGPYGGAHGCQQCLQVWKAAASDDAPSDDAPSVTVRIIDICEKTADDDTLVLWMDVGAFDELDTDGQGDALGGPGDARLEVNYKKVDCRDEE